MIAPIFCSVIPLCPVLLSSSCLALRAKVVLKLIFVVFGYKELWILEFGSLSSKIPNSVKSIELEIVVITFILTKLWRPKRQIKAQFR